MCTFYLRLDNIYFLIIAYYNSSIGTFNQGKIAIHIGKDVF